MSKHNQTPSIMMPALRIPEFSLTTGPIGGIAPVAEAPLVQVSSSSSEENDHDIRSETAPPDASEFSHVTAEEMQVATPETELSSKETATAEGILSFLPMASLIEYVPSAWIKILQGTPLPLKEKSL